MIIKIIYKLIYFRKWWINFQVLQLYILILFVNEIFITFTKMTFEAKSLKKNTQNPKMLNILLNITIVPIIYLSILWQTVFVILFLNSFLSFIKLLDFFLKKITSLKIIISSISSFKILTLFLRTNKAYLKLNFVQFSNKSSFI